MAVPVHRVSDRMQTDYEYSVGMVAPFFLALRDRGVLMAAECSGCGKRWCPPRVQCPVCGASGVTWHDLSGEGVVHTFTIVQYATSDWKGPLPFACAYIQMAGAENALVHWVEPGKAGVAAIQVGTRVRAVLRPRKGRTGRITDISHFEPVAAKTTRKLVKRRRGSSLPAPLPRRTRSRSS